VTLLLIQGAMQPYQFGYIGTLLPLYLMATALGAYLFAKALKNYANQIKRISLWLLLAVGVITFAI
jgi:cytochrome c biogenesis protein CcdA